MVWGLLRSLVKRSLMFSGTNVYMSHTSEKPFHPHPSNLAGRGAIHVDSQSSQRLGELSPDVGSQLF